MPIDRSSLRVGRVLCAALLTLVLAACTGDPPSGTGDAASPGGDPSPAEVEAPADATTPAADPDGVTLITAGDEPRTELRYDIADGHEVDATLRQTQTTTQSLDGQPGMEVSITMLFDLVGQVDAGGDTFTMRASLENGRLSDDTDPELEDAIGEIASAFDGATFVSTFDTRGQVIEHSIENASGFESDPMMMSMLQSLTDQNAFSTPLPAEPVGVGARWSSTDELTVNGIPITQTTETELRSIDGTVAELAITTAQDVPPGPVDLEGMPAGAAFEIEVWDSTSQGTALVDMTSAVPTSEAHGEAHQEMVSTIDGQSATVEQDIELEMELAPN